MGSDIRLCDLEVCAELSVNNFLASFERSISRRSTPSKMLSDNGMNFVAASKRLEKQFTKMLKKGAESIAVELYTTRIATF